MTFVFPPPPDVLRGRLLFPLSLPVTSFSPTTVCFRGSHGQSVSIQPPRVNYPQRSVLYTRSISHFLPVFCFVISSVSLNNWRSWLFPAVCSRSSRLSNRAPGVSRHAPGVSRHALVSPPQVSVHWLLAGFVSYHDPRNSSHFPHLPVCTPLYPPQRRRPYPEAAPLNHTSHVFQNS